MNARQKCKQLKKQLAALHEDYVTSACRCGELMDAVAEKMDKIEESQVVCSVIHIYDGPVSMNETRAVFFFKELADTEEFKRAVTFEGRPHPSTGKYIIEAKLTVMMPEFDIEED